jgi:hypothetical protein
VTVNQEVAVSEKKAKLSRRNFLLTVGAGGAATAAAIVTTKSTPSAKSGEGKRATRGYHATEHVNNYYRTTKV